MRRLRRILRTLKRLEISQATNVRWFGTSMLAAGIAGFGVLDIDGLAKFTAISDHAWYSGVGDANRLGTLAFGTSLFRSKEIKLIRWLWTHAIKTAYLGRRGCTFLALFFGRSCGNLDRFVPEEILQRHLRQKMRNVNIGFYAKKIVKKRTVSAPEPAGGPSHPPIV